LACRLQFLVKHMKFGTYLVAFLFTVPARPDKISPQPFLIPYEAGFAADAETTAEEDFSSPTARGALLGVMNQFSARTLSRIEEQLKSGNPPGQYMHNEVRTALLAVARDVQSIGSPKERQFKLDNIIDAMSRYAPRCLELASRDVVSPETLEDVQMAAQTPAISQVGRRALSLLPGAGVLWFWINGGSLPIDQLVQAGARAEVIVDAGGVVLLPAAAAFFANWWIGRQERRLTGVYYRKLCQMALKSS